MSVTAPVTPGSTFTASIPTPPGPPPNLGARVEVPVTGAIVSNWQPASIPQPAPGQGGDVTFVTLIAPVTPGLYNIHWMTSDPVSVYDAYVPLSVVGAAQTAYSVDWVQVQPEDVRPDIGEVAVLERTRTVDSTTGEEAGVFNENTRPTAAQAEGVIDQAVDDILAELPHDGIIDSVHYRQVKRAITFYAAMLIEGSYYREQANERGGPLWQSEYQEALKNIQARVEEDYLQNNLLATMEPRSVPGSFLA